MRISLDRYQVLKWNLTFYVYGPMTGNLLISLDTFHNFLHILEVFLDTL